MTAVLDLTAERDRRERATIALADDVRQTIHAEPEDPTPMQEKLRDMLEDFSELSADQIDISYNWRLAASSVPLGQPIHYTTDHAPNAHAACLAEARVYLERIERDFGVPLISAIKNGRRPPTLPGAAPRSFEQWTLDEMRVRKELVTEALATFGLEAARELSAKLGFPVPPPELIRDPAAAP